MRRPWSGVALFSVSLLLHAGALLLLLHLLGPKRDQEPPSSSIALVWIRAPQVPAPPVAVVPPTPAPQRRAAAKSPRSRPVMAARAADTLNVAPVAAPAAVPDPVPDARPVFDHAAALGSARKLASEPDPARAGSVGAQIEARRVLSETQDEKMGRTIASGKRSDCLAANGGGSLLSPLMWLLQKKGSGCKLL